ncbi:MAG: DUF6351 family protein [Gammaproteobacteria bacterium]|nr:DUF6351 family protein [Gammaproteobacteria bacterium]MDH3749797.1 DUF6351 family protein [Gammaproteobacteria bacterium]
MFAMSFLALLVVASLVAYQMTWNLMVDRYAGQAQVVGLPPGFDPLAIASPYTGSHPSKTGRPRDPYSYPIPIGGMGPVAPTYTDNLQYPYACRSELSGLGQPLVDNQDGAGTAVYAVNEAGEKTEQIVGYSKDCSLNTKVYYYYRIRGSELFVPLLGGSDDVDELTIDGETVPFVVRLEIGTINRHIYVIGLLRGPNDTPEVPDLKYWNRKLIYQFRGGVGIGRRQGRISPEYIPIRRQLELQQGYAIAYSTANQTSNGYDIELAEDTVARLKRQFSARYAAPRHTIGIGGSGGAIQQYLIAQNNPGLLDGGIALYSYPDMVTQATKIMDCELLEYYFDVVDVDNEKWQTWAQRAWIEGFNARDDLPNGYERMRALQSLRLGRLPLWSQGHTECTRSWRNLIPQITNPRYTYFASLFTPELVRQVPWTYWDNLKRVYGTDENGLGRRTYDNVGVQYGLQALKRQQITVAEFLHLNDTIGGWKPAADMLPERYWGFSGGHSSLADLSVWSHHNMYAKESSDRPARRSEGDVEAMAAAYRSGQVFLGDLTMPVIDLRHYLEPELDMHHTLESFSARLRMLRKQGHADTQVIWVTKKPHVPIPEAIDVLDRWLDNMHPKPQQSVVDAKPAAAIDSCFSKTGQIIASGDNVWDGAWNGKRNGECMDKYPIFSDPRIVAGADYAGDIFKCHLQSVDEAMANNVYAPIDVSAHREELFRIFPDGVCDYTRGDAARPKDVLSD